MPTPSTILLLMGDSEARLLADGDLALQALFAGGEMLLVKSWATRPDWLAQGGPRLPAGIPSVEPALQDVRELLAQPHRLVIFSLLSAIHLKGMRHRDGGGLLLHESVRQQWPSAFLDQFLAECQEDPPLSPQLAVAHLEPVVESLLANGTAVAVCSVFRHVREPLELRGHAKQSSLRERIRQLNLEIAHLSQRTGCFVLDLDRPLAQEGGAALGADCFGGEGRAAEIALDEFAALVLDALPDDFAALETT